MYQDYPNEVEPAIIGIGKAVPKYRGTQSQIFDFITTHFGLTRVEQRILKTAYREAGIAFRHSVLEDFSKTNENLTFFPKRSGDSFPSTQERMKIYKDNALALALEAIRDCFASCEDFKKESITHVITVSCTGMYAPGLDIELVKSLDLSESTQRTTINFMGCYGLFNGMKMAHAICKGDPNAKVLVVSVEICTIHFQNNFSLDNLISNAIFSDGAGALLIQKGKGRDGKWFSFCDFYCAIIPESANEMTWDVGNEGFDIRLSSYVPHLIAKGIGEFAKKLLCRKLFEIKDIDYFAIHPGAKKILEACEGALQMTRSDNRFSYDVLSEYGNMSSATIAFVLKKIWENVGNADNQKTIFSCAFGPGLTLESMILKIHVEE